MLNQLAVHWWVFLIRGILAIVFGVALLVFPGAGLLTIALIFGAYAFVDGILALVAAVRSKHTDGSWIWLIVEGIVGILVGLFAVFYPGATALTLALLLGVWAVVTGVLAIASAFSARKHEPNEWLWALTGVLSLIFGIAVFFEPVYGLFALVYVVSFYAVLAGIFLISFAFKLRGLPTKFIPST